MLSVTYTFAFRNWSASKAKMGLNFALFDITLREITEGVVELSEPKRRYSPALKLDVSIPEFIKGD